MAAVPCLGNYNAAATAGWTHAVSLSAAVPNVHHGPGRDGRVRSLAHLQAPGDDDDDATSVRRRTTSYVNRSSSDTSRSLHRLTTRRP